ncbi:Hypothetical predicted protein [Podarcis lilfordi]|uniref:Uncharacterized protein n=1 Tax=Podarcis lilfordi TaxID=74358 RepID=A0AA35JU92_9SAUR|nr:Hypothetical predicted protein [Podarcis lilfordi]
MWVSIPVLDLTAYNSSIFPAPESNPDFLLSQCGYAGSLNKNKQCDARLSERDLYCEVDQV